jgi:hypothetical protein
MHAVDAMKRSITWGAIVGVALGATVTVALSRGWLEMPWTASASQRVPGTLELDDTAPGATDPRDDYSSGWARPLRPGGLRVGDLAASLPRS